VLGATVLFMAQDPLRRWSARSATPGRPARARAHLATIAAFQLGVGLYGGFFGAGIGILMLAALGLLGLTDIHRMNALKNLAAVCMNGIAALTFAVAGRIDWPIAGLMMVGGVLGGYSGAGMAKRLGQTVVRRLVIGIGLAISAILAARLFVT
jgi:uncharacterized membrane protein YfcA